jgi:hypothetical protein
MPILLLISNNQVNEPYNYLNDVVGVFADDHPFTPYELDRFEFLDVAVGTNTVEEVQAKLQSIRVRQETAFFWDSTQEWSWEPPVDDDDLVEEAVVWTTASPPVRWYRLVQPLKFLFNVGDLTQNEKDLIAAIDVNHPSVDSYLKKMVKSIERFPENESEEIRDLRGTLPNG